MKRLLLLCLSLAALQDIEARSKVVIQKSMPNLDKLPEEHFREKWDRGCSDWSDLLEGKSSKDTLAIKFERKDGQYHLWGQARVRPEAGESSEQLLQSLNNILSTSSEYRDWVFPGINQHPHKNSSYFVQLHDLKIEPRRTTHVFLSGPFDFRVVSIRVGGISTIELKWDPSSRLSCMQPPRLTKIESQVPIWRYRMFPRPDILEWMIGELTLLKRGDDFVDIQTRFVMRPSPLVFSLLPVKLIENELRYRAQRVFQNVVELRRKKVWESYRAVQDVNPSKTKEQNPKSGS